MTEFIDKITKDMNKLTLEEAQIVITKLRDEIDRLKRAALTFGDTYTLKQMIGSGQFGKVYESVRNKDDFRVAVKIVERSALYPQDEDDLMREVEILQSICHPNIIKIYDFYTTPEKYYLVLELAKHGDLFDHIVKMHPYHEKDIRDIIYLVVSAIKFCHDINIIHRDLKPENILVSSDTIADIKICDFGFAVKSENRDLTHQCGTIIYMAPELQRTASRSNILYGREVDMWAIGIITYIMFTGVPPFHKNDVINRRFVFNHQNTWNNQISNEGKAFALALLDLNAETRLTATDAINHPWLRKDLVTDKQLSVQNLDNSNLIQFNAKRRFKKAANAIIWSNRLKKDANSSKQRKLAEILAQLDDIDEKRARLLAQKKELEDFLLTQSNSPVSSPLDSPLGSPVDKILDNANTNTDDA